MPPWRHARYRGRHHRRDRGRRRQSPASRRVGRDRRHPPGRDGLPVRPVPDRRRRRPRRKPVPVRPGPAVDQGDPGEDHRFRGGEGRHRDARPRPDLRRARFAGHREVQDHAGEHGPYPGPAGGRPGFRSPYEGTDPGGLGRAPRRRRGDRRRDGRRHTGRDVRQVPIRDQQGRRTIRQGGTAVTRQLAANIFWGSAAVILCAAVSFYHSYSTDSRALRKLAMQLTEGMTRADDRLQVLNAFVHRRGGYAMNESYYVLKSLRATPLQVLDRGGDCSDKSRLLATMLDQIGIEASPAMLYGCAGCEAVHTVVLARTESGTIAADPAYDLMFPNEAGSYHDVRTMIGDPRDSYRPRDRK